MSPRTCNGYLTKLRNLLDWAQAEGVVEATLGSLLAQAVDGVEGVGMDSRVGVDEGESPT